MFNLSTRLELVKELVGHCLFRVFDGERHVLQLSRPRILDETKPRTSQLVQPDAWKLAPAFETSAHHGKHPQTA